MIATTDAEPTTTSRGRRAAGVARGLLRRRDTAAWLVGVLSFVLGAVFVATDLAYNGGNLVAPLDDAYIHLQYGGQLGAGHPFQYNTGDPISTGESSLLYAFVLAAGYAVGCHGAALLWFAVVLGVTCMAVTAALTCRLGRVLLGRAVGAWSGVLVAVSGPLLWGATSGMEVGLTALLVVATLLSFAREQPRFRVTPVLAFLLTIVRPEGMILALALCAAMVWTVVRQARGSGGPGRGRRRAAWCLLPLLAVAGHYLFSLLATGAVRANGVTAKSGLFNQPVFDVSQFVDRSVARLRAAAEIFVGLGNQDFAFPAALLVALVGGAYLLYVRPRWRPLLIAVAAGGAVIAVSISTLDSALWHEMRYWQPFLPVFILLTVCGLYGLTRLLPGERARRAGMSTAMVVALLFSLVALPTWAVRLGEQAATIRDTDVSVAAWIRRNLPAGAVVGVKDVGAVAYFGGHRVVDTIGLATDGFAEASNNGTGSLYEKLRHLPAGQRPDFFAVYDNAPGPSMKPLRDAGVLGKPLTVFHTRAPKEVNGNRIVPFDQLGIYPADWRLAGSGDRAPAAGNVRDYLNVGDLASERAHGYRPEMTLRGLQPYSVLRRQGDVIDSGRTIVGGERFTVHGLRAGHPLRIVSRVMTTGDNRRVQLRVNGHSIGVRELPASSGGWTVRTFLVPAAEVTSDTLHIELAPVQPMRSPYPEYTSFGYWFVQ